MLSVNTVGDSSSFSNVSSIVSLIVDVKALVGAFNQEKALVVALSMIVKLQSS